MISNFILEITFSNLSLTCNVEYCQILVKGGKFFKRRRGIKFG
ncbi:hypothetical protein CEB3_c15110 [Peptococcaceae bacterium CEB3]|nr:hypothetical protein CEB3_c15110 [Peptococcaceae bacterium CEB3]